MKVKDLVNCISNEKVLIVHGWEYYRNRYTDEQHIYYVDEVPDHTLSMNVCTISAADSDLIQIRLFPSKSLMFRSYCCSCYQSVMRWIDDNSEIVEKWRNEVKA